MPGETCDCQWSWPARQTALAPRKSGGHPTLPQPCSPALPGAGFAGRLCPLRIETPMSKKHTRRSEIDRRRVRKIKLELLRKRLKEARTDADKAKILEKLKKVAPWVQREQFAQ